MGRGRSKTSNPGSRDWDTAAGRLRWLLHKHWQGNCSRMAAEIGISPATVNKIDNAGREPGRRVLEALAAWPKINPAWILSGEGEPYVARPASSPLVLPVADAPLPGSPEQNSRLLSGERIDCSRIFSASQYWLALERDEPLLNEPGGGFLAHDRLLMETDRKKFPAERKLFHHLCVVNGVGAKPESQSYLCSVSFVPGSPDDGPARLEAETFDVGLPKHKVVEEFVVRRFPNGTLEASSRKRALTSFRGKSRIAESEESDLDSGVQKISYADIVAVWIGVVMRSPQLV